MGYMENYEEWLANPYFDEDTKKELESIRGDENEIKEVKDAAQEAVFGSEAVENEKVEDVPEETTKDEQGDSQEPEQISMEGGSDE